MGFFKLDKHIQWFKIKKQGQRNNAKNEILIAMWCKFIILWIFYNFKKDIGINFPNYAEPKESYVARIF